MLGVTLLFSEPSDARKPDVRWRLYVFKAGEVLNGNFSLYQSTYESNAHFDKNVHDYPSFFFS